MKILPNGASDGVIGLSADQFIPKLEVPTDFPKQTVVPES